MAEPSMADDAPENPPEERKIWDLPTRVLKWATALLVVVAWLLGDNMSFENIDTHFLVGYSVAGLLVARLLWGFVGAPASRHGVMLRDAAKAPSYLRRLFAAAPSHWPGHNPLGVIWLYAFWITLSVQIGSGFFAYSDSFFAGGPLADGVSEAARAQASAIHATSANALLALIGLHLTAIFFYAIWKSEFLIAAMITGWKKVRNR